MKNLIIKTLVVAGMTFFVASVASAQNTKIAKKSDVCMKPGVKKYHKANDTKTTSMKQNKMISSPVKRQLAPARKQKARLVMPVK